MIVLQPLQIFERELAPDVLADGIIHCLEKDLLATVSTDRSRAAVDHD